MPTDHRGGGFVAGSSCGVAGGLPQKLRDTRFSHDAAVVASQNGHLPSTRAGETPLIAIAIADATGRRPRALPLVRPIP